MEEETKSKRRKPKKRFIRRVLFVLNNVHRLSEQRYSRADYNACDTLLDFAEAVRLAELTEEQTQVIRLLYFEGLTQGEVALRLETNQQMVSYYKDRAIEKIASVYEDWSG